MTENMVALKRLQRYSKASFPILSVTLGTPDKKTFTTSMALSQFHSLIHQSLKDEERKLFRDDLKRMSSFLQNTYDSRGNRSVVMVSSGKKLWEVLEFKFFLPPRCVIEKGINLQPVLDAINKHRKYLVLLADREKARLFIVHLGEIVEHTDVFNGMVPQKVRANEEHYYGRSDKIFRHIEDHLHRHLQLIAEKTTSFAKSKGIEFIILGGHKTLIPKVKEHLPPSLQQMVIGDFVTELNVPLHTVFCESKKVVEELEENKERKKLEESLRSL